MKMVSLTVVLLLLLLIVGGVLVFALKKRTAPAGGFKDVVKNPEYWSQVSRANAEVANAAEEANQWDDQKVALVVKDFILEQKSSRDAWGEAQILKSWEHGRTQPCWNFSGTVLFTRDSLSRPA